MHGIAAACDCEGSGQNGQGGHHLAEAADQKLTPLGKSHLSAGDIEQKTECKRHNNCRQDVIGEDRDHDQDQNRKQEVHDAPVRLHILRILIIFPALLAECPAGLPHPLISSLHGADPGHPAHGEQEDHDHSDDCVENKGNGLYIHGKTGGKAHGLHGLLLHKKRDIKSRPC